MEGKVSKCHFVRSILHSFYNYSYINAGNGLDQVKLLLGKNLPEDLLYCDKFMTISFKYFASAMRLFQDEVWLDTYHHYALRLKNNGLTFDEIGKILGKKP